MDSVIGDILAPTLSLGAIGAVTGSVLAVSRARPIPSYAAATSLNWTIMGGTFFTFRKAGLLLLPTAQDTPQASYHSAVAGAATGGLANAMMRGTKGLIGSVLLYGALGGLGEYAVHAMTSSQRRAPAAAEAKSHGQPALRESEKSIWQKLRESSPLRPIPDDEFERMMHGKLSELDDQIRLVDEELVLLKADVRARQQQEQEQDKQKPKDAVATTRTV